MNELLAAIGLIALATIGILLARLVLCDGLGSVSTPRSHDAELGSWIDRQLGR